MTATDGKAKVIASLLKRLEKLDKPFRGDWDALMGYSDELDNLASGLAMVFDLRPTRPEPLHVVLKRIGEGAHGRTEAAKGILDRMKTIWEAAEYSRNLEAVADDAEYLGKGSRHMDDERDPEVLGDADAARQSVIAAIRDLLGTA